MNTAAKNHIPQHLSTIEKNYCGLPRTKEGHDPCIAGLKGGVKNACCGHGNNKEAYVQFQDDYCVRGRDAIVLQQILKEYGQEQ